MQGSPGPQGSGPGFGEVHNLLEMHKLSLVAMRTRLSSGCFIISCEFLVGSCGVTSHPQILAATQAVTAHIP